MHFRQFFPLTGLLRRGQVNSLVMVVCIYLAVCAVVKIVDWLVGWVPLVGAILWAALWLVGMYCCVGIIVAVIAYFSGETD